MELDATTILRRNAAVFAAVAFTSSALIYFGYTWFHGTLFPAFRLGDASGDALGSFFIIGAAFVGQRLVSVAMFQDVTRQDIEQAISELHRLDEHAAKLAERLQRFDAPGIALERPSQQVDRLDQGDVMLSQRETHQTLLNKPLVVAASSGPKVELF